MLKFLKENFIFVIGTILLVGLLVFLSQPKNTIAPNENQTPTTDTTNGEVTPDTTSQPTVDTPKTTTPPPLIPRIPREDDERELDD